MIRNTEDANGSLRAGELTPTMSRNCSCDGVWARLRVLRDKEARDAQFVTLCKMSRGAVKYTLHDFLHQPVFLSST
ncbi:hypothetical protein HPB49_017230 [Dermacentor silvarum]|uniref:Uncharacterized protein n=1 Tax=Dermacentor silvarum TaxID=543639 RepID=A0ACB8CAC1_DERSI|nr:hypothetical protein HPB49_017230 [Dermacentor silvarum]